MYNNIIRLCKSNISYLSKFIKDIEFRNSCKNKIKIINSLSIITYNIIEINQEKKEISFVEYKDENLQTELSRFTFDIKGNLINKI